METQKERLIQVRRRTPAEVWDKAIAEYLAGARASEVAAKYGVSAHSIYQRVSGKGKKTRQPAIGNPPSPSGLRRKVGSRARSNTESVRVVREVMRVRRPALL